MEQKTCTSKTSVTTTATNTITTSYCPTVPLVLIKLGFSIVFYRPDAFHVNQPKTLRHQRKTLNEKFKAIVYQFFLGAVYISTEM